MTFNRAFVLAMVTSMLISLDHSKGSGWAKLIAFVLIYVLGRILWSRDPDTDPLPGAVKRGLEDFAKEYRK